MNKEFSLEDFNPKSLDKKVKESFLLVAENFATIMLIGAGIIIIATTWLDIDIAQLLNFRFATDALLTMTLYCMVQVAMQNKGMENGKRDEEYINERKKYLEVRESIVSSGSPKLDEFCEWSMDNSLIRRRKAMLLRHLRGLSYDEWMSKFSYLTLKELKKYARKNKRRKDIGFVPTLKQVPFIFRVNLLKSKILTPDMIILEEGEEWTNDAIAPSPRTVVARKTKSALAGSALTGMVTISYYAFTLASNPSWVGLVFMFIKLLFLMQRAARGYAIGSLAYSVSGVAYHVSQRAKGEEYKKWLINHMELPPGPPDGN